MLEVKRTTNECEKTTENGVYRVVYSVSENRLESLVMTVYNKTETEVPGTDGNPVMQEMKTEIGSINMNQGVLNMYSFPYSEKLPLYLADFDATVKEVQEMLTAPKAKSK